LGAGDPTSFCNANVPAGWITNNDDSDDNCFSNIHDCAGVCDGDSWASDCGCVAVDNSGNDCDDCAGVPNGDSWVSNCGCVAVDNSGTDCNDCAGVPNGTNWASDCGCVSADNDGTFCNDCAGVPNGDGELDNCNTCDADSSNDCVQDCADVWGGDAVVASYYYDIDSDGLGAGSSISLCDANVPAGMVANNDDSDDACFSNVHDCLGECDGTALVDDCGVCDGGNADQDCAGDCFGSAVCR